MKRLAALWALIFVCAGCRAPQGLPRDHVASAPEFRDAAKQLSLRLVNAYPGIEFSVEWTSERLHVSMQNVAFPERSEKLSHAQVEQWQRIIALCVTTPAPSTTELKISARTAKGSWWYDRAPWKAYERSYPYLDDQFFATPEFRKATARLLLQLREEHRDMDFSLDWNSMKLSVLATSLANEHLEEERSPSTRALLDSIITSCLKTPSPPTEFLRVICTDGVTEAESGTWEMYERKFAIQTPRPETGN